MRATGYPRATNSPHAAAIRFSRTAGQKATSPGLSGRAEERARNARSNSLSVSSLNSGWVERMPSRAFLAPSEYRHAENEEEKKPERPTALSMTGVASSPV